MKTENIRKAAYLSALLFILIAARLWHLQILKGGENRMLSEENRLRIIKVAAPRGIIFDRKGIPLVKNSPYYSVSLLPEMKDNARLRELSDFLGITPEEITDKIKNTKSAFEPIRLKENLTFDEVAYIEARLSDYPGLIIDVDLSRQYLYGEVGAHLIGYIGKLTRSQASHPDFGDVPREGFTGQWGIERLYDKTLRGTPGERVIEVDALGREIGLLEEKKSIKGQDLALSIDIDLQAEAEKGFGERVGALVAVSPKTGEILGLVSKPSFDPNLFAKGISPEAWLALSSDPKNPMLNRAFQSQYPPGSTFKIITAIAALETGSIEPGTTVTCTGSYSAGSRSFGCWRKGGHGAISLHRAIVESCDVFFYIAGSRTGIDGIARYARELGLGSPSGLDLVKERTGLIPDTEWKLRQRKDKWYLGETFNSSIGQGYVSVTPFQMARLTAEVANGGYIINPVLLKASSPVRPGIKIDIGENTLSEVKDALRGVVNEPGGTGGASRSSVAVVSGKTGTAQVVSQQRGRRGGSFGDHAWFVAYAPSEDPEIAVSVFVEHGGHGGSAAAPIAKRAIEAFLSKGHEGDKGPGAAVTGQPDGEENEMD
jgi:penicillin-binding protein 2